MLEKTFTTLVNKVCQNLSVSPVEQIDLREVITRRLPGAFEPGEIMLIEETLDRLFSTSQDINSLLLIEPLFHCNIHIKQTQRTLDQIQLSTQLLAYLTVVLDVCIKTLIACCLQITTISGQIGASHIQFILTQHWSTLEMDLTKSKESTCTTNTLRILKVLRTILQ